MKPALRILKNSSALTASVLIERGIAFFLPWYVARVLGREVWGDYSTAYAFVLIAAAIAPWGLIGLLPREVARKRPHASSYLANGALIAAAVSLLTIASVVFIARMLDYPENIARLIYLGVILAVLPSAEATVAEAIIMGLERMEWIVMARFPLTVLRIGASVLFLSRGYDISILFIILAAYYVLLVGLYLYILRKGVRDFRLQLDVRVIRQLAIQSIPFFLIVATSQVFTQFDRIFLSKLRDSEAVGVYATGIMLVQLMYLIAPAIMNALFPGMSRAYLGSREWFSHLVSQLFKFVYALIFPVVVIIFALADPVIDLVFGQEYQASVIVLRITAFGILPSFLSRVMFRTILASDNERSAIIVAVLGNLSNIVLLVALVPAFGVVGASYAAVGTVTINLLLNSIVALRIVRFNLVNALLWPSLCAAASLVIFFLLFSWNVLVALALSLIVFITLLVFTRTIMWSELKSFRFSQSHV